MPFEDITVEQAGSIATVIIDRGDGRNALRPQTLRELCDALDSLVPEPTVRAIVLTAAGKHFSAGAEFSFLKELTAKPGPEIRDQIYGLFQGAARRLWDCPKPTVAAINGAAVTVGCELALACDFRIASPTANLQESWVRLGLIPPLGGLYLLPRMLGLGRATEIAVSGRPVGAEEAERIGLVTRIVAEEELIRHAQALASELAALPPLSYHAVKEGLHRGLDSSMANEWQANVLAQTMLLASNDFKEAVSAIVEKREANFSGT